jgi:hypothetical protein
MKVSLVAGLIVASVGVSLADEAVNCEAGQRKVSFADGNNVTEVCVDNSEMDTTQVNPEIPTGVDESNTDGHTEM